MDGRQNKIAIVHPFLIRVDAMKTETKPKTKITTEHLVSAVEARMKLEEELKA